MIDRGTKAYADFLSKVDYYKQLLKEIQSQDIEKVAKDTNLCYEIVYACSTLKDLSDNEELRDTVEHLYKGFESYIGIVEREAKTNTGGVIKKHKKLLKVKYDTQEYKGDYEKEHIIKNGDLDDKYILKEIAYKLLHLAAVIMMYYMIQSWVMEGLVEILVSILS